MDRETETQRLAEILAAAPKTDPNEAELWRAIAALIAVEREQIALGEAASVSPAMMALNRRWHDRRAEVMLARATTPAGIAAKLRACVPYARFPLGDDHPWPESELHSAVFVILDDLDALGSLEPSAARS
jgi:hypothetical protein